MAARGARAAGGTTGQFWTFTTISARMRPPGRADQCPQLGVERTQRGRRLWAVHGPQADLATDRQNPPRAILAQLEVAHRLPGAPMKRSVPRGANIGPSSWRTGEILVSRKVGDTSLAEMGRGGSRAPRQKLIDRAACRISGALLSSVGQHALRHQITDAAP